MPDNLLHSRPIAEGGGGIEGFDQNLLASHDHCKCKADKLQVIAGIKRKASIVLCTEAESSASAMKLL